MMAARRMGIRGVAWLAAMAALAALSAAAQTGATNLSVSAGAEVRLRYDLTDNLPTSGRGESDYSSYARVRVRPWIGARCSDYGLFLRLADEFRHYSRPATSSRKQRWPDVAFIDSLYFTADGLLGCLDVKAGRQDMSFGSERILSDGTGGDGTRSAYFDALRLTWHAAEGRTLDAFAFYMDHKDWMPTLGRKHENGKKAHDYDTTGYNQDEFGAGLYWQDRANADFGYDVYYVAKKEFRARGSKYRREGRVAETHTFGVRLLPQFTETLSGEVELAGQVGTHDLLAGQAYGGLTYAPKLGFRPKFTGAVWALSGDSTGERGEHAWHAVFNRETGLGESIAPMYTKYDYTNLIYPHLAFKCDVADFSSLKAQVGPLFTAVKEDEADGQYRGAYVQVKYEIELAKLTDADLLRGGKFALQGEYFGKGDYFRDGSDGPALFGRAELSWSF